jgi:ankyrin repeat protein
MPLHQIPVEILLMIARALALEDEYDDLRFNFADVNSLLKVNRALYVSLNRTLWQEAALDSWPSFATKRVFTHLIRINDLTNLNFFLELGAYVDTIVSEFDSECGANEYNYSNVRISDPTPLKVAAHLDNVPMARLLLEYGADIVQYDDLDRPSHSAIHAAQSADMVQLLLDHHADPEQQLVNELKFRPLHYYVIRGNIEAMRVVLRNGVKVDPDPDPELWSPLDLAVQRNVDAVKLLLEHGADVKKRDSFLDTPLHHAAKAGKTDVVRFLMESWPDGMKEKNERGFTPLLLAIKAGKIDVVRFVVESWPDGMREKGPCGNTPLHLAAATGGTEEAVRLLVETWPEGTREKDDYGNTPLHLAAKLGQTDIVRLLVETWPEGTREKDDYGNTPLHSAAAAAATIEGAEEAMRLLLESWPDGIREKNKRGNTPLHSAAATGGTEEAVRLLVERWPESKGSLNQDEWTPLMLFERVYFEEVPGPNQRQKIIALLGGVH